MADVAKAKSIKTKLTGGWAVATAGVTFTSAGLDQAPVDLRVVQVGRHGRAADHPQREGSPEDGRDPRPARGGRVSGRGPRTCATRRPVSVTYHVAADGTLVYDSATGGTVTEKTKGHVLFVRFNGTFVGMFAWLKSQSERHVQAGRPGLLRLLRPR